MIFAGRDGDTRVAFDLYTNGTLVPRPGSSRLGGLSASGTHVSVEQAWGLPVVSRAIRSIAGTVAQMECCVFEKRDGIWQRADGAPQEDLLSHRPNPDQTAFDFFFHAVSNGEGWGNFYAQKVRSIVRGQGDNIVALLPLASGNVRPKMEDGELVYKVRDATGQVQTLSRREILHIPGILAFSPYVGVSPIALHRDPLGRELALEEFQSAFYQNDATPGLIVNGQALADKRRRDEFLESWQARHRGGANAHLPGLMWGDMELTTVGVAPRDAEYAETRKMGVREVGNVFEMDSRMLNDTDAAYEDPEKTMIRFRTITCGPRVARIWQALWKDNDLFPDKALRPQFVSVGDVLDARTAAEVDLRRRQSGTRTPNELRAKDGLPPHPDGDDLQATPVGGAPNPDGDPGGHPDDKPEEGK